MECAEEVSWWVTCLSLIGTCMVCDLWLWRFLPEGVCVCQMNGEVQCHEEFVLSDVWAVVDPSGTQE